MVPERMNHANEGIKCVVDTCHYYMNGDHCAASMIEVQPRHASDTQQTDCATFIPEAQAHL